MESEKSGSGEEAEVKHISPEIIKAIMDLINSSILKEGQNIMPFDSLGDYLRLFLPSESRISNFLNVRAKGKFAIVFPESHLEILFRIRSS